MTDPRAALKAYNKDFAAAEKKRKETIAAAKRDYNKAMGPILAKYKEDTEVAQTEFEKDVAAAETKHEETIDAWVM